MKGSRGRLLVLVLVLTALAGTAAGAPQGDGAGATSLRVRALIDGVSDLVISDGQLWWQHRRWQKPGFAGRDAQKDPEPTYVDGRPWTPTWTGDLSSRYDLPPAVRAGADSGAPTLKKVSGRGGVSMQVEQGRVVVTFDDGGSGGADWYEIELTWGGAASAGGGTPGSNAAGPAVRAEEWLRQWKAVPSAAGPPPALDGATAADLTALDGAFRRLMTPEFPPADAGQIVLKEVSLPDDHFFYAVQFPAGGASGALYPALVRLGYPLDHNSPTAKWRENLQAMYGDLPDRAPRFLFRSGIIDDVARPGFLKSSEASSSEVFHLVARRWDAFLDTVLSKYPIDPDRLYITGQSYEAVQALSAAFHAPDRIAGVASFSTVVYPFQIYFRYENALNCKVLVYRGDHDHMFTTPTGPVTGDQYRQTEIEFGRRLEAVAPQNTFVMFKDTTHQGVYLHSRDALREVFSFARPDYPHRIGRRFLLPSEGRMEWVTVTSFEGGSRAFSPAFSDWDQLRGVSYSRMQSIERCPSLAADACGSTIDITEHGIRALDVYLGPALVDVTRPITIRVNGRPAWRGEFRPSLATLITDYQSRHDLRRLFWQRVSIDVGQAMRGRVAGPLAAQPAVADPAAGLPRHVTVQLGGGVAMEFALIPPGEFTMGSPADEKGRGADEEQHKVRITRPFYMGATEVTCPQWTAVMGTRPWGREYEQRAAATFISYQDAVAFCRRLSATIGRTVELPTEAQWEYACRAGTSTAYPFGSDAAQLRYSAWYKDNAGKWPKRVGLCKPNDWGLYDMEGNVWEWCRDWWQPDYYAHSPADDPFCEEPAPKAAMPFRVLRGGSWAARAQECRSAKRHPDAPDDANAVNGFRVVVRP